MADNVVALWPKETPPTAKQLMLRIRAMSGPGNDQIGFDEPHFRERMLERGINMRQVLETVRKGTPVGAPRLDEWGDWRLKLERRVAGRRVQVVVAVKPDYCECVTVI